MPLNRRTLLNLLATSTLASAAASAWAAQPVVEIIAFDHPPVRSALKPLRDWLATQGGKLRVVEIDMESAAAAKRLQAVGLTGHIPVVVLVNGRYQYQRKDGSRVAFVSFPAGAGTPAGVKGSWSAADVQAALQAGQ